MPQHQGEDPLSPVEFSYDSSIYYLYWSTFSTWESDNPSQLSRSRNSFSWRLSISLVSLIVIGVLSWQTRPQVCHSLEQVSRNLDTELQALIPEH